MFKIIICMLYMPCALASQLTREQNLSAVQDDAFLIVQLTDSAIIPLLRQQLPAAFKKREHNEHVVFSLPAQVGLLITQTIHEHSLGRCGFDETMLKRLILNAENPAYFVVELIRLLDYLCLERPIFSTVDVYVESCPRSNLKISKLDSTCQQKIARHWLTKKYASQLIGTSLWQPHESQEEGEGLRRRHTSSAPVQADEQLHLHVVHQIVVHQSMLTMIRSAAFQFIQRNCTIL